MLHHRTCNLCQAMCGLTLEVEGARVTSIRGDDADVFSRGASCADAQRLAAHHADPARPRLPLRRRPDGSFESAPWDDALEDIARRIAAVQKQHGRDSVAFLSGPEIAHDHGALLFSALFIDAVGSSRRYSAQSSQAWPFLLASYLVFGHQALVPVADIDHTQLLLLFGVDPVAGRGSLPGTPGMAQRLAALRARGGRLVVLDPRRSATAALADQHLTLRAGSDVTLLLALVHTLVAEGLAAPGALAPLCQGLDGLAALTSDFSPELVAARVGLDAATMRGLARELAAAPAAVCIAGAPLTRDPDAPGQLLVGWLLDLLHILTGNLDRRGGSMFAKAAIDLVDVANKIGQKGSYASFGSRVRNLPELGGELPVATLAEDIDTPGPGQLRALVRFGSGPPGAGAGVGSERLSRALAGLDLLVCMEARTPGPDDLARHAHFILPPTSALERDHFDLLLATVASRNTVKHSPALFAPAPDARHAHQIFLELATRVAAQRGFWASKSGAASRALMRKLGPDGLIDWALRLGPYKGLSLKKLGSEPHGHDLGALEPCLPRRLATPGKRLQLMPAVFVAELARVRELLVR